MLAIYTAFFMAISAIIELDSDFGWLSLGYFRAYRQRGLLFTTPAIAVAALALLMHFQKRWLAGLLMIFFGLVWSVNYIAYIWSTMSQQVDGHSPDQAWALIVLFVIPNLIICWAGILEISSSRETRRVRLRRRAERRRA